MSRKGRCYACRCHTAHNGMCAECKEFMEGVRAIFGNGKPVPHDVYARTAARYRSNTRKRLGGKYLDELAWHKHHYAKHCLAHGEPQ